MFEALILSDNTTRSTLKAEWGLCVHITYNGIRYLLDTGASDLYLENAKQLGVDISRVDHAVLSHAHYDHSGGYPSFFNVNRQAKLFLAEACAQDCYFHLGPYRKYIGIPRGILEAYRDRIIRTDSPLSPEEGVWLIPHLPGHLETIGKRCHLGRKSGRRIRPDDFAHELSLVFDTPEGLIILNSCSHAGLQHIVGDVQHVLPGRPIRMTIGGLHLAGTNTKTIRRIADTLKGLNIPLIYTDHCTGQHAFHILKETLGERVQPMFCGQVICLDP